MNIQTDPARIRDAAPLLPAAVDTPIRFAPGKDLTLHALGYDLAAGRFEAEFDLFELDLRQRANDNADTILAVVTYLGTAQQNGEPITPAANWLLDNHYLVEDTILQVRRDLPPRFFKKLPLIDAAGRATSAARARCSPGPMSRNATARSRSPGSRPWSRPSRRSIRCRSANCGRCRRCCASCWWRICAGWPCA